MDYTTYTAARFNLDSTHTPTLCELFKYLSIETWKRMEFAYTQKGMRIWETTLTQNIIFTINAFKLNFGLPIRIQESKNEKVNGRDIELVIKYPQIRLAFYAAIQAKKLYKSDSYDAMYHHGQTIKLIAHATKRGNKRINGCPLYLLYNYHDPKDTKLQTHIKKYIGQSNATQQAINNQIGSIEKYGCSIISAHYISKTFYPSNTYLRNPSFLDLHSFNFGLHLTPTNTAIPWENLVCAPALVPGIPKDLELRYGEDVEAWKKKNRGFLNGFDSGIFTNRGASDMDSEGLIGIDELDDEGWVDLHSDSARMIKKVAKPNQERSDDYAPMYRITITIDSI